MRQLESEIVAMDSLLIISHVTSFLGPINKYLAFKVYSVKEIIKQIAGLQIFLDLRDSEMYFLLSVFLMKILKMPATSDGRCQADDV